jgi:hypothetical protein
VSTSTKSDWLTPSEARRELGCSQRGLDLVVARGELRPMRLSRSGWRRFHRDDLDALIERYRRGTDAA